MSHIRNSRTIGHTSRQVFGGDQIPTFEPRQIFFGPETETDKFRTGGANDALVAAVAESLRASSEKQAATDSAATALQRELGLGQLAVSQGTLGLAQRTQAFTEQDTQTQRLLEAAGLATGPTGAIQLAFLARGQGAPPGGSRVDIPEPTVYPSTSSW